MDNSWENKNKNLIDKYNIRNIYIYIYISDLVGYGPFG